MNSYFTIAAAALLVIGLIGNGYEMKRVRSSTVRDEDMAPQKMFANRRNLKWYACIGGAMVLAALGSYT